MIRNAKIEDLDRILQIYAFARIFMKQTGNPTQWEDKWPPEELLIDDINKHILYVCFNEDKIYGVFALIEGDDPTYAYIEDGKWLNDNKYVTIHRIANCGSGYKVLEEVIEYVDKNYHLDIRIDTHKDNVVMKHKLLNNDFLYCDKIYTHDASIRDAYHRVSR